MSAQDIALLESDFAFENINETLGLEARPSLASMKTGFSKLFNKFSETPSTNGVTPVANSDFKKALKTLDKVDYSNLTGFTIRTPEYYDGEMLELLNVLEKTLEPFLDINDRILHPLRNWLARAVSVEAAAEQFWIGDKADSVNVPAVMNPLKSILMGELGDDLAFNDIHKVYPRKGDFRKAVEKIEKLTKTFNDLMAQDILGQADAINRYVTTLVESNEASNFLKEAPKSSIKKLYTFVNAGAHELEAISLIGFQIQVANAAMRDTFKKIDKDLG